MCKEFYRILVDAGLAQKRTYEETGKGSRVRHKQSPLSFHSLRHTATSLLKNAGVSDAVARDIIGHDSAAVSAHYTHIDLKIKKAAVNKLPDVLTLKTNQQDDGTTGAIGQTSSSGTAES